MWGDRENKKGGRESDGTSTEEPSYSGLGALGREEGRAGASREADARTTQGECSKSRSSQRKGALVVVNREAAERDCAESGAGPMGKVIGLCLDRESAEPDMLRGRSQPGSPTAC